MNEIIEKYESNVRSYCRKWPAVFDTAKGSYITDVEGKRYLDFFCGAGALNYGHNNDAIKAGLIDWLLRDGILHGLDMTTAPKVEFINAFEKKILEPRGMDYKIMFPGPTGTNAVESALKIARKATGRNMVWSFMGGFHGMTLGALSVSSDSYSRSGAGVALANEYHVPAPYMMPETDIVQFMQTILDDDHSAVAKPAAVIMETTQAEGGIYVMPTEFLKGVREFCTRNDILMVVDDIQVGCWRTGTFFSFERAGIQPDIVCLSKSIGGIGLPFALVLMKPEFDVLGPGEHNGTFRGNQLAMVAAKAAIDYSTGTDFASTLPAKIALIDELGAALAAKYGVEMRGLGFIRSFQLADGATVKAAIHECFENGLLCEACGRGDSAFKIMPACTVSEGELREGFAIIDAAFAKVLG